MNQAAHEYYPLEQVTWADVKSGAEWREIKDYVQASVPIVHTVGYVLDDSSPTVLKLAATVCIEDGDCSDTILIPKGCILRRELMGKK